jgi:hypothetical protein
MAGYQSFFFQHLLSGGPVGVAIWYLSNTGTD